MGLGPLKSRPWPDKMLKSQRRIWLEWYYVYKVWPHIASGRIKHQCINICALILILLRKKKCSNMCTRKESKSAHTLTWLTLSNTCLVNRVRASGTLPVRRVNICLLVCISRYTCQYMLKLVDETFLMKGYIRESLCKVRGDATTHMVVRHDRPMKPRPLRTCTPEKSGLPNQLVWFICENARCN